MKKGTIIVVTITAQCVWVGELQTFLSTKGLYDQQFNTPYTFKTYNVKDVDAAIDLYMKADFYSKYEAGPCFDPKDRYKNTLEQFNKLIIKNVPQMDYSQWNKKIITKLVMANKYSKKGVYFRNKKGTNVFRFIAANNLDGDFRKIEIIFYQYRNEKTYLKIGILNFIKNYRFCNWHIARKIMQNYKQE